MASSRMEKLEAYALSVMDGRRKGAWPTMLRALLRALSWLFGSLVQLRLALYRYGILRHHALGCQVLSVGNLTVGGTGKTPIVEAFARELARKGRKVAILSRGYKKKQPTFGRRVLRALTFQEHREPPPVVSDGTRLLLDSSAGGDEPYMLATNLPDVAVIVGRDRVKSGRYAIEKLGCNTLILDDGFQYLALRHRLDIVLVDRTNPFGNGKLLPRGILRGPIRNLRRAGFVFITKSNGDGADELKNTLRRLNPDAQISECRHCARNLQDVYTREVFPLERLRGLEIAAVSGIAVPKSFEDELVRLGAIVKVHKQYTDHHRYTQQEILNVVNHGLISGCRAVVTTEKDAVRFPLLERRDLPILFLRVEIEMLSGEEAFHDWIERLCFA
ncbi:MAG: tetraacyldisaccharide 4'-kinase [Kiritimatiellia bacterium]|nr:tetraacyldisaccharide 4'-kinase [Kiritimatiellia bacterium]